jgi:hypothetical protein
MKTLNDTLKELDAYQDGYDFAKDLTIEQFLETCPRGDWILWLFVRLNPTKVREVTLAAGHCANTIRHLMKDEHCTKAIDAAIAFGEGKITHKELDDAAATANAYAAAAAAAAADAHVYTNAAYVAAAAAADAYAYASGAYVAAAKKQNQLQTADICRKYLPIELWGVL